MYSAHANSISKPFPNFSGGDGRRWLRFHLLHRPMRFKNFPPSSSSSSSYGVIKKSIFSPNNNNPFLMAQIVTQIVTLSENFPNDDHHICTKPAQFPPGKYEKDEFFDKGSPYPSGDLSGESRIDRAWAHWRKLGAPKYIVAPMVDHSELPFRLLCRKYGATAAYTPMLHSRIFCESEKYRAEEFTTCEEDRPLFVQLCANDPDTLLEAAQRVVPYCDYVDINLGCPQRIASRGNYGAFLMNNLPLVKSLVEKLALNLSVPVSCKIRIFPDLEDTLDYAKMLEDAGCSLLAVHGRTRDEKNGKFRANWDAIKAVKNALRIPVLANGNVRHMGDVHSCLEVTGADGVLSAESLLGNPALFAGFRTAEWVVDSEVSYEHGKLDQAALLVEYLKLCEKYPVPWRMIRSHVYKMLGDWFRIHPHVREDFNAQSKLTFEFLYSMIDQLRDLGVKPLYVKGTSLGSTSSKNVGA